MCSALMFTIITITQLFGDRVGAPMLLPAAGVVLISVAVAIARIAPRIRRT